MTFFDKLEATIGRNRSLLCLGLDPSPRFLPHPDRDRGWVTDAQLADLGQWLRALVAETRDLVCAYKPTLDLYLALGPEGLALLESLLRELPADVPVILDAKHANGITSGLFAQVAFDRWRVDALTVAEFAGLDQVAPFLTYPDRALFALCYTENPSARPLLDRQTGPAIEPANQEPFWRDLIRDIETWGVPSQVGLEVEASDPDRLGQIRQAAPQRLLLVRGLWSSGAALSLQDYARDLTVDEGLALDQALRRSLPAVLDETGQGAIILVPRSVLSHPEPAAQVRSLRHRLELSRQSVLRQAPETPGTWPGRSSQGRSNGRSSGRSNDPGAERAIGHAPNPTAIEPPSPHRDLILQLHDLGCILFGTYVQASGETFPYYIDLRQIISQPVVFHEIVLAYAEILAQLSFDRLAGIPYGSLPTATGLALHLNRPMIYPRKEVKAHGTQRVVEGTFYPGERVVVVDDILISGKSAIEGVGKLESVGLHVSDVVVLIDHESGARAKLAEKGYRAHAVLTLSHIVDTLYRAGRLDDQQFAALQASHA